MVKVRVMLLVVLCIAIMPVLGEDAQDGGKPEIVKLVFDKGEVPKSLCNLYTADDTPPSLSYRLPENYSKDKQYPLILYVPGFHGKSGGTIRNAIDIAGSRDCVVASLPLFKKELNSSEYANGVIMSFSDYDVLSKAYETMLGRLFEIVPNIDSGKSAMVGFSNGAITVGILVSMNNQFILEHFHNFCQVDQGMYHLTDLHKSPTKYRRFLIMVGDRDDYGREYLIRGAKLAEDAWKLHGVNIESRVMKNTGHELTMDCKEQIREWIFGDGDNEKTPTQ